MTNEEAIKILQDNSTYWGEHDADKFCKAYEMAIEALKDRPTGHWVENPYDYECSECHIVRAKGRTGKYNYCPSCGAKMA